MDNVNKSTFGRCHIIKNWSDWDNSIHSDDSQIDRQGRSMTYPFTFDVDKHTKTARFSSTSILPFYETTLTSCTCEDFQSRKLPCKHIYRLAVELGYIEIIKRPTFDKEKLDTLKNSADIDADPDQIKRQKSSMTSKCKPTEINYADESALFSGSGKSPYVTTLNSCTCRDFVVRKLPCKHIYRLRYELNNCNK
ncbi:SWIM zinc finger family protein [Bacteroides sp.]|uniref:SWIM zinc finger family protein n=1 Tax=Bacteroides sp. TaxID=29523 RepID=UPI0026247595|nr:SWIM zinc finger family protein [Bacteroides sp.]MDD3040526.1 SWIM zinc finger domain-containing protein [Bacteroides sp.]